MKIGILDFVCIVILTYNNKGLSASIRNMIFLFIYHYHEMYFLYDNVRCHNTYTPHYIYNYRYNIRVALVKFLINFRYVYAKQHYYS